MRRTLSTALVLCGALALAGAASAETWKNVVVIDTLCLKDFEAKLDEHTRDCALQCEKGGYGLVTADGKFLKFDAAGNQKAVAALKASKKEDHLRGTVVGELKEGVVHVKSVTLD
jgi:hypothetical protein